MKRIWYELLAFCFELDIPNPPIIILDEDYVISFKYPDVRTSREIRVLISTFAVMVECDLLSDICWIRVGSLNLRKRNYKQFVELLEIIVNEKCTRVDN